MPLYFQVSVDFSYCNNAWNHFLWIYAREESSTSGRDLSNCWSCILHLMKSGHHVCNIQLFFTVNDAAVVKKNVSKRSHNLWYESRLLSKDHGGKDGKDKAKKVYCYISPRVGSIVSFLHYSRLLPRGPVYGGHKMSQIGHFLFHLNICNQDASQLRTAFVSPQGVLNKEVLLYLLEIISAQDEPC
jgi:hypothetical protein